MPKGHPGSFCLKHGKKRGHIAKDGKCRLCVNSRNAKYKAANPEKVRESSAKYRAANYERILARARAAQYPLATRPEPAHCELCGGLPNGIPGITGRTPLRLDHCHDTHLFRGWLCAKCNQGLGLLGDNLAGLIRAVEYLQRAETENWLNK